MPIRTSTDQRSVDSFPWLFAVTHVLHRFETPRHPPLALCSLEKNKLFLFLDARARSAILKGQRHADTGAAEACRPTTLSGGSLKTEERTQLRARGRRAGELNLHCSTSRGRIASAPTGSASPDSGLAAGGEEVLLRKEVIQPHLPVRLPCYDFTPITDPTFDGSLLQVGWATGFGCCRLSWCDGRCVQGPGTYSPRQC